MTPQEIRYAELLTYINNPRNRKHFPLCVKARERELKTMSPIKNHNYG